MQVFTIKKISSSLAMVGLISVSIPLFADETEQTSKIVTAPVVVTATRTEQNSFDLPMSIDVTDAEQIQDGCRANSRGPTQG